jgi:hypothetical protein
MVCLTVALGCDPSLHSAGPPGPVLELSAIPIGVNQLKVQWRPPRGPNWELLGYKIYYRTGETA